MQVPPILCGEKNVITSFRKAVQAVYAKPITTRRCDVSCSFACIIFGEIPPFIIMCQNSVHIIGRKNELAHIYPARTVPYVRSRKGGSFSSRHRKRFRLAPCFKSRFKPTSAQLKLDACPVRRGAFIRCNLSKLALFSVNGIGNTKAYAFRLLERGSHLSSDRPAPSVG